MRRAAAAVVVALCTPAAGQPPVPAPGQPFRNWDGVMECTPRDFFQPRSEAELVEYVRSTVAAGETVKVVGGGLSFSPIAMCNDGERMVNLDHLDQIESVKRVGRRTSHVTVQAGIRMMHLNAALADRGLTLRNMGKAVWQSVAGVTQTGTHGTGDTGSTSVFIVGLRLIDGEGQVRDVTASSDPELFAAVRTGIGALGIITAVTLETVDQFRMRMTDTAMTVHEILDQLPTLLANNARMEWGWVPNLGLATLTVFTPTEDPITGCWHGTNANGPSGCVDVAHKTMSWSPEHMAVATKYTEMEMHVPVERHADAIAEFYQWQNDLPLLQRCLTCFTFIRYTQADDIPLSPQFGRDNAIISMIVLGDQPNQVAFERYARALEDICMPRYAGRPHWGKRDFASAADIAAAYPATIAPFRTLRARVDPHGTFLNAYLRRVLGTAGPGLNSTSANAA